MGRSYPTPVLNFILKFERFPFDEKFDVIDKSGMDGYDFEFFDSIPVK